MRTIGDKTIKPSGVVAVIWDYEKEINIEFHKDGKLEFDLDIVLCYDEDTDTGFKTMKVVKINDEEVEEDMGGGNDLAGHVDTTISDVLKEQYPDESQKTRNKWRDEVQATIDEALESEDMEL